MRYHILTATFAGLIAGSGLLAAPAVAQDMMGPDDKPKAEGAQDEEAAKKAADKAAKRAAKKAEKAAQKKGANRQRGLDVERYVKQSTEALGLNEEQSAQLRTILTDSVAAAAQIRSNAEAKNKELEASREKQIRELLTDEQTAKYEELRAEREERRAKRGERGGRAAQGGMEAGGRRGGGLLGFDPRKVIGELALDENQQAQARDIMQSVMGSAREKIGAAREQGPEAVKAAVAELRENVKSQFTAILDADQQAKFAELTGKNKKRAEKGEKNAQKGQKRQRKERKPATPAERMERRLGNVMEAMGLSEDEAMILQPKIQEILQLDADTGATADAERKALETLVKSEGEVDGDAIRARMESLRQVREQQLSTRTELEAELRELVTIKQEGMLFLHRVLR